MRQPANLYKIKRMTGSRFTRQDKSKIKLTNREQH